MGPYYEHYASKIEKNQVLLYYNGMKILAIETSCDDTGIEERSKKSVFTIANHFADWCGI